MSALEVAEGSASSKNVTDPWLISLNMEAPVQIVLCFDGTGNTFRADGTETNILKICRMLKRSDDHCQLLSRSLSIHNSITDNS